MTYHLARNPAPPNTGKPSSASMNTAIASASPGRSFQSPDRSSVVTVWAPGRVSAMMMAKAPYVASV